MLWAPPRTKIQWIHSEKKQDRKITRVTAKQKDLVELRTPSGPGIGTLAFIKCTAFRTERPHDDAWCTPPMPRSSAQWGPGCLDAGLKKVRYSAGEEEGSAVNQVIVLKEYGIRLFKISVCMTVICMRRNFVVREWISRTRGRQVNCPSPCNSTLKKKTILSSNLE